MEPRATGLAQLIGVADPGTRDADLTDQIEQLAAGLSRLHRRMVGIEQEALYQDAIDHAHFYSVVADHLLTAKEAALEALQLMRCCD